MSAELNNWILKKQLLIFCFLGIASIVVYVNLGAKSKIKAERELQNRMCKAIFVNYMRPCFDNWQEQASFRVSFLKAQNRITFNPLHKRWYTLNIGKEIHLQVSGRYQSIEGPNTSNVYFTADQGAAGCGF